MRDIQMVLERWGAWAASDSSGVDYSPIAAGFKGLLPYTSKTRQACSDSDALIIEGCLARLKQKSQMSTRCLWHIIYTEYPSVRLQRCVERMKIGTHRNTTSRRIY
ncbi:hypothetical protein AWF80_013270 [Escherichia coli]|nr:hypothetical protein AWF80_013270 [Escherichia coli]TRY39731.1 hypothetical protein FNJ78_00620 [Escherichia coli]